MDLKHWDKRQIKLFVRDVIKHAGGINIWHTFLTPTLQEALIAQRALAVVCGQAAQAIEIEAVEELRLAMRIEAGLWQEPTEEAPSNLEKAPLGGA